ncbi:putative MACPF domain-containing protein CAD1 [Cocos nucifera]|uniref:Putative MACPF domain-containing protein CAD1 n=1 Tax=Cocos nucifera TaxID=13894 RepID=A0A8K0NC29_COCNU|nr:putative MACPF domain-containing protein CAD1 [Cocos nucifera]
MESSQLPPASSNALIATLSNAVQALGRGFDVTSDTRLLYCKGAPGSRLVLVDEGRTRDFVISDDGDVVLPDVSLDIDIFREQSQLEATPAYSFQQMAEYFNKKSGLSENVPLGSFNSMFSFTGSWKIDAAATKALAMNGYFMPLYKVILMNAELVLREEVRRAVPRSWDPSSLARFLNLENQSSAALFNYEDKIADPSLLNNRDMQSYPSSVPHLSGKEDVTVIFRRRGGDDLVQNHAEWKNTVPSAPDVINMTFLPIVSLLNGLPGIQYLARAIDLYLEYKPPIEELQYFLEFQIQRVWAPAPSSIPGHQRKEPVCPSLQFSLMGPKLYISSEQIVTVTLANANNSILVVQDCPSSSFLNISVGRKPVTGLRLCLEGSKQNRLAIHLQHLASLPKILLPHWDSHVAIGPPKWQGPEEQDSRWFEPIKWKNFAHVSTAPIENTETNIGDLSGVYIVTGAQLGVWDFGAKSVLHLKLLFSRVPGCTIRRSVWDHSPSRTLAPSLDDTSSSSDKSSQLGKLAKMVDMTEMSKGPEDTPGHWIFDKNLLSYALGIETIVINKRTIAELEGFDVQPLFDRHVSASEVKAQKSSVKKKKHMVQKLEKDHDNWAKEAEDCHQKWESTEGEHLRPSNIVVPGAEEEGEGGDSAEEKEEGGDDGFLANPMDDGAPITILPSTELAISAVFMVLAEDVSSSFVPTGLTSQLVAEVPSEKEEATLIEVIPSMDAAPPIEAKVVFDQPLEQPIVE